MEQLAHTGGSQVQHTCHIACRLAAGARCGRLRRCGMLCRLPASCACCAAIAAQHAIGGHHKGLQQVGALRRILPLQSKRKLQGRSRQVFDRQQPLSFPLQAVASSHVRLHPLAHKQHCPNAYDHAALLSHWWFAPRAERMRVCPGCNQRRHCCRRCFPVLIALNCPVDRLIPGIPVFAAHAVAVHGC